MQVDRNGLEVLDRDECLRLLATAEIGRVIVTMGALPAAFPVNFALWGADVVFRTSTGSKLVAATNKAIVAFEADEIDRATKSGWSVLVTGPATALHRGADVAIVDRLSLQPWLPGHRGHVVRIQSELVSGRRLGP
ncbi:MAG TPA: pyridoxamine 5'-phosphate oxidase family protein [Acidimicrobiales bacterium]|nr:pyridoxamine 5'-phosphate oxidase family protein [Acidimicrobiales bacterium]